MVVPYLYAIKNLLTDTILSGGPLANAATLMQKKMDKYVNLMQSTAYKCCMVLDPRIKLQYFEDHNYSEDDVASIKER